MEGTFGQVLRHLRSTHGLTQAALGALVNVTGAYISDLELGRRSPQRDLTRRLDAALGASGTLEAAANPGGDDVRRRNLLGLIGVAAAVAASDSVRQGLAAELDPGADEWDEVAAEYGLTFYTTSPRQLLDDLTGDLALLHGQIGTATDTRQAPMWRAAGQLAAVTAMAWASTGQTRQARHWWRTARRAADQSRCLQTRMWVRGWEVADGLYEQRPIPTIVDRASEAIAIGGQSVSAGTAGMWAGLAQTLAVAGRADEARRALYHVAAITDRLPGEVVADADSMFGWPEVRLRHTQSYVYTALGDTSAAYEAQDRALALYPQALVRERAAMLLHRATCMVRDGDIVNGLHHATAVLDGLPAEHRTELVHAIGRQTLAALPDAERGRPEAVDLAGQLGRTA